MIHTIVTLWLSLLIPFTKNDHKITVDQPIITLISPQDSAVVQTPFPVFSWTTSDITNDLKCTYHIKVVEILPGQSGGGAILANPAAWEKVDVNMTEAYPATALALQPGKSYAWRITATNAAGMASWSDTWVFSLAAPSDAPPPPLKLSYAEFTDGTAGPYYARGGIGFRFDALFGEELPVWKVYDAGMHEIAVSKGACTRTAVNLFQIDLRNNPHFSASMPYILKVWDAKGKSYQMKFLYFPI